jgi:hypothetical protein
MAQLMLPTMARMLLRRAGGVCGHEGYNLVRVFQRKGSAFTQMLNQSAISHDFTAKSGVSHAGPVKEGPTCSSN